MSLLALYFVNILRKLRRMENIEPIPTPVVPPVLSIENVNYDFVTVSWANYEKFSHPLNISHEPRSQFQKFLYWTVIYPIFYSVFQPFYWTLYHRHFYGGVASILIKILTMVIILNKSNIAEKVTFDFFWLLCGAITYLVAINAPLMLIEITGQKWCRCNSCVTSSAILELSLPIFFVFREIVTLEDTEYRISCSIWSGFIIAEITHFFTVLRTVNFVTI